MRILFHLTALLLMCQFARGNIDDKLQCKDENDKPVDWYVLYKLPKIRTTSNPLIRKGLAYVYITSDTIDIGWRLSTRSIRSNNSIPGYTLAPLYERENEDRILWNLYNDSPPDAPDASNRGHTKGVVMADRLQGFWLIHSVPSYPPVPRNGVRTRPLNKENITVTNRYDYPESGTFYGQSFLCVSLGADQFDIVGKQLMFNEIAVYSKNLPASLKDEYPVLTNATNQKRIRGSPYKSKVIIQSLEAVEFTSFAKNGEWGKDHAITELYADLVAPQLQSDMYVETWLNGRGTLPSNCSRKKIYNVKSLTFEAANVEYSSSRDHSKWAITIGKGGNKRWVCVGDINRADTQFSRGGGTVCFRNASLWNDYRDLVNDVQPCTEE